MTIPITQFNLVMNRSILKTQFNLVMNISILRNTY